jgi:L-cysteine desulfidase
MTLNREFNLNSALLEDIQPFLGCTDISIIALGTALASFAARGSVPHWVNGSSRPRHPFTGGIEPGDVISLSLQVNEGLYKSSHATVIPNAGGNRGAAYSAALGLFCDPGQKLNLFADINQQQLENMKKVAAAKKVRVETIHRPDCNLFLHCQLTLQGQQGIITAESCLQDNYTRVVFLRKDGNILFHRDGQSPRSGDPTAILDIPYLVQALDHLSADLLEKLAETVRINRHAYEYGLKNAPGLGVGARHYRMIQKGILGDDIVNWAACKTAAAEDVRMAGVNVPVMGITSSGSHGITASIPVIATAEKIVKDRQILFKSLALSFRLTQIVDGMVGRLSAPCGCVIKAGIGATAGVTYYLGGTAQQIEQAINHFIVSTAGVICDGAKPTCSLKLANSAACACQSALMALEGLSFTGESGGIVRDKLQQNIQNMIRVSKGMQPIDPVVVDILKEYRQDRKTPAD